MLDWSKIDTWQKFQEFVNALVASEVNQPGLFVSSNPSAGADGGWDGMYPGYYEPEKISGLYSVQSKYTGKNYKDAVSYLSGEIRKELEKAKKNGVEHLRIVTNADLKVEQIIELKSLLVDEVKTLEIWCRADLDRRAIENPFLRNYYFGDPQFPAFVPGYVYFPKTETELTDIDFSKIERFEKYMPEIEGFYNSDKKILLIHAPGGNGKSHLLREISKRSFETDPDRVTLLIRTSRDLQQAFQEELKASGKYTLVLDDADRNIGDVSSILRFLQSNSVDLKIVLCFRTAGIHIINQKIESERLVPYSREILIHEWSKDELVQLLRMVAGSSEVEVKDEKIIVSQFDNPYLIVWVGNQIKKSPLSSSHDLEQRLVNDVIYDSSQCLGSTLDVKKFLFLLAATAPIYEGDTDINEKISSDLGISIDQTNAAIGQLEEKGILRKIGRQLRFNPDMKGDLYLSHYLSSIKEADLKGFLLEWLPLCPSNVFSNVGAALAIQEEDTVKLVLADYFNSKIESADKDSEADKGQTLEFLAKVCFILPKESLNLLNAYLDNDSDIDTDKFGPVILNLADASGIEKDLLLTIEKIAESKKIGRYDNYKPKELMEELFSPLRNSIQSILKKLDVIENWSLDGGVHKVELLKDALSEVLSSAHEFRRSYANVMEFGERALLAIPAVIEMRNRAIGVTDKMLSAKNPNLKVAAIEVLKDLGVSRMGHINQNEIPLSEKISEERSMSIPKIKKLISEERDYRVLCHAENLLIEWWAQQKPGHDGALDVLRVFPRNPEYLAFRYLYSPEYTIEDVSKLEKAPSIERWKWFVENVMMRRWSIKPEDFKSLLPLLSEKYNSKEKVYFFLKTLSESVNLDDFRGARPIFVYQWAKDNPDVFKEIRDDDVLWSQVHKSFRHEIDSAIVENDEHHFEKIKDEVLLMLPDADIQQSTQLIVLSSKLPLAEQTVLLKRIAKEGNETVVSSLIFDLYKVFQSRKDSAQIVEILLVVTEDKTKIASHTLDNVEFIVKSLSEEADFVPEKKPLQERLLSIIQDSKNLSYHEEELLDFCIEDLNGAIALADYRLKKSTKEFPNFFDAIPHDGLKVLSKYVSSYSAFKQVVDNFATKERLEDSRTYGIEEVLEPVAGKNDETSEGKTYIAKYLEEILTDDIERALTLARLMPLNEKNGDIFIKLGEAALKTGKMKEIKSLLMSKTFPRGGWQSTLGVVPKALLEIKEGFEKLSEKMSAGKLKSIAMSCLAQVNKEIEDHQLRDAELLADRR